MLSIRVLLCLGLLLLAPPWGVRGESRLHVPQARLPLMKTPPTIDGHVNDDEWASAARMERFAGADGVLSPQEAAFWVGCDGRALFIAVVSQTPPNGKILSRVTPLPEDADARTWLDDSVEMVIDPLRTDTSGRRRLFHANINALGAVNDTAYNPGGGGEAWRGHWRTASKVMDNRWHFEAALPLADMNVKEEDLANPFGIRVVRNWHQRAVGPEQTEWSALGGAYLSPETIPVVTWDSRAPIVHVLQVRDPVKLSFHTRVAIGNPRAEPLDLLAIIRSVPRNSAPTTENRAVNLPAGGATIVELAGGSIPGEDVYTLIQVASPDKATIYYLRDFILKLEQPDPLWILDEDAAKKVDVSFAYYPYHNTIQAAVNVNGLEEKEKVSGVKLGVRAISSVKLLASTRASPMQKFSSRTDWVIPALEEGSYEFVVELEGIQIDPVVVEFARHVMPWEHNQLGKSDVVVEPFEPIRVKGRRLHTILRTHALNKLGLWDQVESIGKPLLKSPMRLEVQAGGKKVEAKVKRFRWIENGPTRALSESLWSAGGLQGAARSEWDYDGMMLWTLELQVSRVPVDSITMVIPLDDRMMPLFHVCTDGLRFNYSGATPSGQGRVWDGSKAARNSIIGSYVPYIWVGAEERGLAVFGDNDRGWVRSPGAPCQELVRQGETLELRLNLVAAPTVIEQPRRILIGFLATPTKPMPLDWRGWLVNTGHPASTRSAQFLGCCYQWGTLTPYDDIYPRDEDFRVYDKLAEARRTGVVDREFFDQWMASTKLPSEAERGSMLSNLDYGFRVCASKPANIIAYTNARAFRFDTLEGQTFLDEWYREAFVGPKRKFPYGSGATYGCNPVESFRDYAMWYYRKMLETFCDGIYWDNVYLQSAFDTVGTDAYELSPGTIQPSSGIFNMRQLVRRTAVLFHELKKRPFNMAHMTNTATAPILSFCHTHLTWEDRSGDSDFQDRFSRDYLRAESIGLQHGNVPFALVLVHGTDEAKNTWARRTATGVLLTHEIRSIMNDDPYRGSLGRLLDFGYGRPDVRVYNYWQADLPVRVEGSDVSMLVVSKAGSAMVVVCDYGNGGDLVMSVVSVRLGLRSDFTARDAETGEALPASAGKVTFPLRRHDFRMIVLE